ncbi:NAD-dependent malic enzyme, mitochondrial-like [Styela clava]
MMSARYLLSTGQKWRQVLKSFNQNHNARCISSSSKCCNSYAQGVHTRELGGKQLLLDPHTNKGLGFTLEERQILGMHGLLPPIVLDQDRQLSRIKKAYSQIQTDLERYSFLTDLQERNEKLFFRMLQDDIELVMPIVYTPTVGLACMQYGNIFRRPRGMFITIHDRGYIADILQNWPAKDVRAVVVTDGQRILGLGDLGSYGMGIPCGKLALYTACGGIHPHQCLPVCIDVGTDNEKLLSDPFYIGLTHRRVTGIEYDELIDEFMEAVSDTFGRQVLIQFEDFGNHNAFRFLRKYRNQFCTFNDDIQGTASVAVGGLLTAEKIVNKKLTDMKFLFAGAGEAALGIANLVTRHMWESGKPKNETYKNIFLFNKDGLLVKNQPQPLESPEQSNYAHDHNYIEDFNEAVKTIKPDAIIGVAGAGRLFTKDVLESMAEINERPIIFALSNPTDKAECTAEEAYTHTKGQCIFASGSPFDQVTLEDGRTFTPGQGNNVYIFPGVALGVISCGVRHIPDQIFLIAAKTLANEMTPEEVSQGRVYPNLKRIQDVSINIAVKIAEYVYAHGMAGHQPEPVDKYDFIRSQMYSTDYESLLPSRYDWPEDVMKPQGKGCKGGLKKE